MGSKKYRSRKCQVANVYRSRKCRPRTGRVAKVYRSITGKSRKDQIPQIPTASLDAYKCSFFPQTIRDWNDLPDSLISSAEMSDDCVSKFSSLVRARD